MIREAIILAGGLGTRLRSAVPDLPKCMAPVAGRPFIAYVIDFLRMQGINHFIFSLGYKSEIIEQYLTDHFPTLHYSIALETEPLGTGGAIAFALTKCRTRHVLIANGDTLFKIDLRQMSNLHIAKNAACTIGLKPMRQFDRYGVVTISQDNRIDSFQEKKFYEEGLINGGLYILDSGKFFGKTWPKAFSFEKEFLERECNSGQFYGSIQNGYFIDIGIPEDFNQAQKDLERPLLNLNEIDSTWTLFLDRDGVINEEKKGHYILNWSEFNFTSKALDAFNIFKKRFHRLIIVSNQRGIGKDLMTDEDLRIIHELMHQQIKNAGGHIDHIYYCSELDDKHHSRKPNPGMALQATLDFPDIDLNKSIIVGNKPSDMQFGRAAGMFTVFVRTTNPEQPYPHPDIDLMYDNLYSFALALK